MPAPPDPLSGKSPVTIKDVARAAGVHFSTVSLALRDSPRIPTATRDRIHRLASQLGYKRQPVQFALTARRTTSAANNAPPRIAFLTNRPDPESFFNTAHMRSFLAGAREQAEAMGYACDLLLVGDSALSATTVARQLETGGTAGLILAAFQPRLHCIQLDWTRYAVVKIDSAFMPPAATLVSNDQMQITRLAFQNLHRLGYRRIGMAVGQNDEENTRDLFSAGCLLEQERLHLDPIPPLHFRDGEDHRSAAPLVAAWVKRHRIDVVASNWASIAGLLDRASLRVPGRIACACLCLNAPDPALAGVIESHHLVGRKAAEALALLIQNRQRGTPEYPSATYVAGLWHDGPSAPPADRP